MNKLPAFGFAAILLFAAPASASAQTFSGTVSGTGSVEIDPLSGGLPGVFCSISVTGVVYPNIAIINQVDVYPGHPLCGTIDPWGSWVITTIPSNYSDVDVYIGFDAPMIPTRCYGQVQGSLSGGTITFSNVNIPPAMGANSCYVTGSVNLGLSL